MNKHCIDGRESLNNYKHYLKIMRITLFFLFFSILFSSAANSFSQEFTFKQKSASIREICTQIEKESDYVFVFSDSSEKMIDKKVNIDANAKNVAEILDAVLSNTGLTYKILDKQIVIYEAGKIISAKVPELKIPETIIQQPPRKQITGKVTDAGGQPLPGVTVVVKGTTIGTVTDADGEFSLNIPLDAETLQFSFVGMQTQEIPVNERAVINVTLTEEVSEIEEIVVIGYGTVKKKDLTGAVSSVQGTTIAERQATQISQALQGAMPGVMVTRNNNAPGATATIRIRGITTIGENDPLVIIDGVPIGGVNDVNPNDVESITVLKDAASASIYGARAAAGVILITTKRAKTGEIGLQYNAEYGFEKPTVFPEFTDAVGYMKAYNELIWNDNGNQGDEYSLYPKDVVDNYATLNAENPDLYPNTDWRGLILNDNASRQSHLLTITGGSKVIRAKASLGYDKTDALYDGRTYERITGRFNNDITITKYLSASLDFSFKRSISKQPTVNPISGTMTMPPVYAAVWSDGRIASGKSGLNVYGQLKYGGFNNDWNNQIGGKMSIDFTPLEGLKLSAVISPMLGFDKGKTFNKKVPYYSADDPTVLLGTLQEQSKTTLSEGRNDYHRITKQFLVNYTKSFGRHNLNAMAGYEDYYAFNENLGASRDQYELTSFPYLDLGPLEYRDNYGDAYENAYTSYFGRIMYNYKNKYLLQGNIRYDGSSRFHKDYRWGSFPSFSAGWVMTEESFMKNIRGLSFLKLRASWGALGNERIGNYPYQAAINFSNALFFQGNNVVSETTAAQWQYVIHDISWEKTESYNFGLDAGFFDNRLRLTADYYKKTTKDMLLALEIPDYIGFDNPDQNTGEMYTNGWEAQLDWNGHAGDLGYSVSLNLSDYKSVMGDLGGTEFIGDQIKIEGSEFNEWYGYRSDGLFQTQEEVDNSPKLNAAVKPGDVKYLDISGPDGVPDGKISPEYDRVLLGGSLPRYLYGANIRLDYKNFDLSFVFQGVGKILRHLSGQMVEPLIAQFGNVPEIIVGKSWSMYNSDEQNLNAKYPRYSLTNKSNNYAMSDFWLVNGAYFRVKNVTLGYNIPTVLTQKLSLQGVRVYVSASDLFTIDNYPKGWDPEVAVSGYPITASYVVGLSVTF